MYSNILTKNLLFEKNTNSLLQTFEESKENRSNQSILSALSTYRRLSSLFGKLEEMIENKSLRLTKYNLHYKVINML